MKQKLRIITIWDYPKINVEAKTKELKQKRLLDYGRLQ